MQKSWCNGRDRIVVSTSRCGQDNPGSNPGQGRDQQESLVGKTGTFAKKKKLLYIYMKLS